MKIFSFQNGFDIIFPKDIWIDLKTSPFLTLKIYTINCPETAFVFLFELIKPL